MRPFGTAFLVAGAIVGATIMAASAQPSSANLAMAPIVVRPAAPVYRVPQNAYQAPYDFRFDACKSGRVKVSPCPVVLTTSNPAQQVTVKAPAGSTITEKDNCTNGTMVIATVQGSANTWLVSAGNTVGRCKAKFTATDAKGHKIGHATLPITNKV